MPTTALKNVAWSVLASLLCGCGDVSAPTQVPDAAATQVSLVGALYGQYLSDHAGAAPANEAQFIESLNHNSAGWKKLAATPQELLTSPRDGQPLVVVYGVAGKKMSPGGFPWVAHEQAGVDGRLMIVDARGTTELKARQEVDQAFAK